MQDIRAMHNEEHETKSDVQPEIHQFRRLLIDTCKWHRRRGTPAERLAARRAEAELVELWKCEDHKADDSHKQQQVPA